MQRPDLLIRAFHLELHAWQNGKVTPKRAFRSGAPDPGRADGRTHDPARAPRGGYPLLPQILWRERLRFCFGYTIAP
jgi:hypothetical protein